MDDTGEREPRGRERRRSPRVAASGVAVLRGGDQPPSVWRVADLSPGGAALIGDVALFQGRLALTLYVPGFAPQDLQARIVRRQLATRNGRCALQFLEPSEDQRRTLEEIIAAERTRTPSEVARRVLLVGVADERAAELTAELGALGFRVRRAASPGQAAAWLEREKAEVLLVDDSAVEADRWSVLQFARDTAPEVRRFVLASDVRGFRLYFAIKAGLVEALIEPAMAEDELARRLLGTPSPEARPARRARRRGARLVTRGP